MDARCLVAVLLACPVLAQTFVVDASNGAGTTWTDLGTATAAAPAGATLLVRPGQYGSFTIANKSLTILGDPGAIVADGEATIGPTASTQRVALRGLHFDYQYPPAHFNAVVATNCVGPVLLESVTTRWPPVSLLAAQSCAQVTLRNVTATGVVCVDTSILLEGCVVSGPDSIVFRGIMTTPPRPALSLTSSTAQIAHTALRGGWGCWVVIPVSTTTLNAPAVLASFSNIRVLGASTLGANSTSTGFDNQLVQSSGGTVSVRLDPQVVLTTTAMPPISPSVATQTLAMPDLRTVGGALGSTMTATTRGPIGHLVFVLLSLPAPTRFIPGIADPFWIDDAAHQVFAVGLPQLGAPVVGGGTVPNDPWLRGQMIVWQSVSYDHVALVQASNPSPVVLR